MSNLFFDCSAFFPELILCFTIVFLLILRLLRTFNPLHLGWVALPFTLLALVTAWCQWTNIDPFKSPDSIGPKYQEMFSGLLVYDNFTVFLRLFLLAFACLLIWLSMLTGIPDREDSADFYSLLLGSTLGMCIMASANHLLMVFLGVEMASLPSYALAGFLKGKRQGSEASLKYVVYGGGASGIMLYGISLLAGKFGTAYLPDLAKGYMAALKEAGGFDAILLLGTLFILIGLGFKIAAVPFHFWCPDVFEGAAAEVAAFLSVASKGAALALVGRLTMVLAGLTLKTPDAIANWIEVARYFIPALAFFAAVTATFGNLAAFPQTNLKRLLAYSTIAQAGYMMMGLASLNPEGASAVLLYLVAYLVMNLGAFAIVAFLRNQTGSEDLSSYKGMVSRAPLMTILLAIFLLSLLGLPPLAGFAAKFQIFSVLFNSGNYYNAQNHPELGYLMYALLVIGGINSVISAVYYLKVLKVMILDKAEEADESRPVTVPGGSAFYGTILAVMVFVVFLAWQPLGKASDDAVNRFRPVLPITRDTAEGKP
ncbi:MAG TPA: NADH-quinone oxidoreductase subunit N [Gemmataceae bacterium]|nr:NADH-quinone oxidoreductase subunit N [Gemmataceae bacterium]